MCAKPLIAWTIESAGDSHLFDRVVVSTDSQEIARIAKEYGAEVPFLRPVELGTDAAQVNDTFFHCLQWLKEHEGGEYDAFFCLQPTSPLRSPEDIINSAKLLEEKDAGAVISVCPSPHPPSWMNILPSDGNMRDFLLKTKEKDNRQEEASYYVLNGAIFCSRVDYFLENDGFYNDRTYAYIMPRERSVDIDDEFDLSLAEFFLRKRTVC